MLAFAIISLVLACLFCLLYLSIFVYAALSDERLSLGGLLYILFNLLAGIIWLATSAVFCQVLT